MLAHRCITQGYKSDDPGSCSPTLVDYVLMTGFIHSQNNTFGSL